MSLKIFATQPARVLPECHARCQSSQALFLKNASSLSHVVPRVITVDKNAASPKALKELKAEGAIPEACELRQVKYLNNIVEQDHRFLKRRVKPGLGFFAFETAWRTLQGYEAMHMIRKGQLQGVAICFQQEIAE